MSDSIAQWEYKVVTQTDQVLNNQAKINRLGREGWELVNVVLLGTGGIIAAYMKRPRTTVGALTERGLGGEEAPAEEAPAQAT